MHVIEQYKAEKNGLDVYDDIPRYAELGWDAIPKDDIERLKWCGVFLRRQSEGEPGYFMMRIRIPNGIATSAQLRAIAGISRTLGRNVADITTRQQIQTRWIKIDDVPEALRRLHEIGSGGLMPDRTLVLLLPPEEGARRAAARDRDIGDRFARRDATFHARVAAAFAELAAKEPERVRAVDASGSIEAVTARLLTALEGLL